MSSASPASPQLVITVGDPCGIGPEIVLKAVADGRTGVSARMIVVGHEPHLRSVARELDLAWPFAAVIRSAERGQAFDRPVLFAIGGVDPALVPGQASASSGRSALAAIETGVRLVRDGVAEGIVTAPIHKEAIALAGCPDPGHTELLQRLTGAPRVGMLFWTEDFSVALLTTHMSLVDAIKHVRAKRILDQLLFVEREWARRLGRRPRVAVAGLNPHSGEGGRFGVEETRHIRPAIDQARARGLLVSGPVPPDVVFAQAKERMYDLVFALYHDQGTIPVKLCYGRRAVNVTLGLPFVRTSVDHGTAMDIAGQGMADAESLVQATCLAAKLCRGNLSAVRT